MSDQRSLYNDGTASIYNEVNIHQSWSQILKAKKKRIEEKTDEENEQFHRFYRINDTIQTIFDHSFTNVALQFPDELLHDSAAVSYSLQEGLRAKGREVHFYILGDTSYGSCCVDEVAAEHGNADFLVHYGRACLSPTRRLPVMHVFGEGTINIDSCFAFFENAFDLTHPDNKVLVLYDLVYSHAIPALRSRVDAAVPSPQTILWGEVDRNRAEHLPSSPLPPTTLEDGVLELNGLRVRLPGAVGEEGRWEVLKEFSVFYIGEESTALTQIMLELNCCPFKYYVPSEDRLVEGSGVTRLLMKRYYMIEKTRTAETIGILACTLGVDNYLDIIAYLKRLIIDAGKKPYVMVIGKLNEVKLNNFPQVDMYVLVACPQNSLIDSREFNKVIATPYEVEIALNPNKDWTGRYIADFRRIVAHMDDISSTLSSTQDEDGEYYEVSLITGRIVSLSRRAPEKEPETAQGQEEGTLVAQSQYRDLVVSSSPAVRFMQSRTYTGLDPRIGEDGPAQLVEGLSGVARGYQQEGQ